VELASQLLERGECSEECDVRDHEPCCEVADSERVARAEEQRIEREERGVALASGLE